MDAIIKMLKEIRPEFDFSTSDNFIEDGFLDSFDVISLIGMMEEEFSITIDGLDIVPENFVSYDAMIGMITKNGGKI